MSPKGAANASPPPCRPPDPAVRSSSVSSAASFTRRWRAASAELLPIDSSGTLEITGIHVDVGGQGRAVARATKAGAWLSVQGFRALWAKTHNRPISEAPTVPDSTLDELVSSIVVEREQIGPNRYIADLGILFDRARSAELLGVGGEVRRSAPMLLIPVLVTGGHGYDRRASQSLAARLGGVPDVAEPDRLCPGERAGRRSAAGQCGAGRPAGSRLVAQHHRPLRRGRHSRRGGSVPAPLSRADRRSPASSVSTDRTRSRSATFTISGSGRSKHARRSCAPAFSAWMTLFADALADGQAGPRSEPRHPTSRRRRRG